MAETSPADAPETANAEQIAYWNDRAGATWTRLQDRLDALFEPITEAAVDAAAPAPGERAIDVGSGCGATVLALARRVGPAGQVTGLDVSEPMSGRARERIAAEGLTNARIIVGDAAAHTLPPHSADLLFSRFGVMFFDDPVGAFTHLRSAVRPGGRLLFAVWRDPADNTWMRLPLEAARGLVPPQPPADPTAPGPFAFADKDRLPGILERSGWREGRLTRHDVRLHVAPAGGLEEATDFAMTIGPLARALAEMEPEARAPVRQAVRLALQPYDGPDGIVLNGSVWLVSARV